MSSYRFTAQANRDVEEIALYLFDLNPVAADRFLAKLGEACELLAKHPRLGRPRPKLGEELHSFPIANYLVFYMPVSDGIVLIRVLYGGRDLPGVLRQS